MPARGWLRAIPFLLLTVLLTACGTSVAQDRPQATPSTQSTATSSAPSTQSPTPAAPTPSQQPLGLTFSVPEGAQVPVDHRFMATATGGIIEQVSLTSNDKRADKRSVPGSSSADKTSWTAGWLLEPGDTYTATVVARSATGEALSQTRKFSTQALTNRQQVFVYNIPGDGATVGVAMPVVVTFDLPVVDKASFEAHMAVTSTPAQTGAWRWVSDKEVHYRPQAYWQAGTEVDINIDVNGVSAGGGLYGQESKTAHFTVGRSAVINVDLAAHTATQVVNGQTIRVIPITGGKSGFQTRSGTKVIMERLDSVDMNAASTGTSQDSPEFYNLKGVKYAMRVTQSGEFFHAAPWSIYAQGKQNVSHGCVGMSTDNADWLMDNTLVGDPAVYTGSSREIEDGNGWSDWNIPFASYARR